MRDVNLKDVDESVDFEVLQPGGYVCVIRGVKDDQKKEYLEVKYDIAEGKNKDHFTNLFKVLNFWGGKFYRSYKEKALPFFKAFITATENSNNGYIFNYDEKTLVGKLIGLVLSEEEYVNLDGEIKTRLYVSHVRSVDKIRKNDFKINPLKKYDGSKHQIDTTQTRYDSEDPVFDNDDIPF